MKRVGDLLDRHVGRGEQMFDLHHDLPIDELFGGCLRESGGYLREIVRGDAKFVGIEFYLVLRIAVFRHQFAKAVEEPARGRDGCEVFGRGIEHQADLHREKQILQLIPYHHAGRFRDGALHVMVGKGVPCLQ